VWSYFLAWSSRFRVFSVAKIQWIIKDTLKRELDKAAGCQKIWPHPMEHIGGLHVEARARMC
jgi:hypothetical protein